MSATSLAVALALAATGCPVFPCTVWKTPAIAKLRGGQGFKDASTDLARIREPWAFAGPPAQLVGVPTGAASGFDLLDLDPRHGSNDWRSAYIHRLPETRVHSTMSGGEHWLFIHIPGVRNIQDGKTIAPGVDVRGEGGYAVWPPSAGYSIDHEAAVADWPGWLLAVVLRAAAPPPKPVASTYTAPAEITDRRVEGFIRAALNAVAGAQEGEKHYRLRSAALQIGGVAARAGLSDAAAIEMLVEALPSAKSWDNARRTSAWGLAQGRARPIVLPDRDRPEWRRSA